jgi:hypothetical protein
MRELKTNLTTQRACKENTHMPLWDNKQGAGNNLTVS